MRPDDPRHGTKSGGRVHRDDNEPVCAPCRRAEARYEQARQLDILNGRPRRVAASGIPLRIQALVTLGHSFARIGAALDMTDKAAWSMAHKPKAYACATTVAKIDALYDAWSMQLPPETTMPERKAAKYARTVAAKHGWLPPLALDDDRLDDPTYQPTAPRVTKPTDVDEVAIARRMHGDKTVRITPAERLELVRRWVATGRALNEMERITGVHSTRYRNQLEEAS
jgi:hypothetical protein